MKFHLTPSFARAVFSILVSAALFASPATAEEPDAEVVALQAALKGTWQSVCMDVGGTYIKTTVTYDGAGNSTDEVHFYSDAACTNPTGLVKSNTNTYSIGKKVDVDGGGKAFTIDIKVMKWKLAQGSTVVKTGGAIPTQYDIVKVEDGTLYNSGLSRAKKGPITNPAERPKTLDKKNHYKKK